MKRMPHALIGLLLLMLGGCAAKVGQPGPVLFDAQVISEEDGAVPFKTKPDEVSFGGFFHYKVAVEDVLLGDLATGRLHLWLPMGHSREMDYFKPALRILGRIEPSGAVTVRYWAFRKDALCVADDRNVMEDIPRDTLVALDASGKTGCKTRMEK
jgi:hypothetical protein